MSAKKLVVLAALVVGISGVGSYQAMAKDNEAPATQPVKKGKYTCKHCGTFADEPGKCPTCGMEMKKAKKSSTTQPTNEKKKHTEAEAH